jgi:hypothetical protein
VHEFIGGAKALAANFPEGFQSDIETDFVPVLEAVCDGLGRGGDQNGNPFDKVLLMPFLQRFSGVSHDLEGEMFHLGCPCRSLQGNPDLMGGLGCQVMEPECREEADYPLRNFFSDLGQGAVFTHVCGSEDIETP